MAFSLFPAHLFSPKKAKCHYQNPASVESLSDFLSQLLCNLNPGGQKDILILCIGTDRSTGDCLGPLVGWLLQRLNHPYPIYGTLNEPVHAGNLTEWLSLIQKKHLNPLIIAVDACLGKLENVGMITLGEGEIKPGAGVHKKLPAVGDIYFTGTVNVAGHMEFIILQNTRLSVVMQLASLISECIMLGIEKAQKIWAGKAVGFPSS